MSRPLVVFDLDGTLIDSRRDLAESANDVLTSYGAVPLDLDRIGAMIGEGAKVLMERALAAAGLDPDTPDALGRFLAAYDRRLLGHTRPYDGIEDALRRAARGAQLAVLTNKPAGPTRRLLEAFGLGTLFPFVVGGDSAFPRKPDPASLRFLMTTAGATVTDTLFVGDSMTDVLTARAAGVPICVAWYGYGRLRGPMPLDGEELIAATPEDVGRTIDAWLRRLGGAAPTSP
jgi:phosphoglycolate phosphatase